jgi:hypothetical protein
VGKASKGAEPMNVECHECGDEEWDAIAFLPCDHCGEPVCPDCSWLHGDIHHPEGAAPQGEPAEAGGR